LRNYADGIKIVNMSNILHNATVDTLLERRSIRKFKPKPLSDDIVETLETVAQHAASSQFLNDWSAIRITDPAAKKRLAEIGGQPYIATAPLLYVFVLDEHRNAAIAASKGVETASDEFTLNGSYRYTQAQNDAVFGASCDGDGRLFARPWLCDSRLAA
jgi:FMN reductase (NADPH)